MKDSKETGQEGVELALDPKGNGRLLTEALVEQPSKTPEEGIELASNPKGNGMPLSEKAIRKKYFEKDNGKTAGAVQGQVFYGPASDEEEQKYTQQEQDKENRPKESKREILKKIGNGETTMSEGVQKLAQRAGAALGL